MKKKKLVWITVVLCLVCALGVYATPTIVEKIEYATAEIQPGSLTVKNNLALREIIKEQNKGLDVQADVEAYAHFLADLYPSEEEIRYIDSLIGEGYNTKALIEIYEFWKDTQEELTIIKEVYAYRPPVDDVRHWVDSAFVKLSAAGKTKGQYSSLSVDEVKAYYKSGVSYEDILMADKLSRHGTKDITHVLSRKQENASWFEIIDDVYVISPAERKQADIDKYKQIQKPDEILASIRLAEEGEIALEDALDNVLQGVSSLERLSVKRAEKRKMIKETYIKQGLWDTSKQSKQWGDR